jgi:hypothetical protein
MWHNLREDGYPVYGIDASPERVRATRHWLAEEGLATAERFAWRGTFPPRGAGTAGLRGVRTLARTQRCEEKGDVDRPGRPR